MAKKCVKSKTKVCQNNKSIEKYINNIFIVDASLEETVDWTERG